ncbi:dienelactone hydrolase [Acetobacteraceae bacterium H6797]|nr:dienelactone hydrolase [Acetobacteraceae bacterium H6797]
MRALHLIAMLLAMSLPLSAGAQTTPFHAGVARPAVTGEAPFEMLVWYPTDAAEVAWQAGSFPIHASRHAPLAEGRLPVLLLSHGGGLGGGTPFVLREISMALARQGYIVIAPFHGRTGLQGRVLQMERALAAVEAEPRFAPHLDMAKLAMLGFSLGTAVTLELAGAVPNPAHLAAYCEAHPSDAMSCTHAPDGNDGAAPTAPPPIAPLPLKAIVLMDPFAVLFQRPELASVTAPALIFRPRQSELPGEANATALAANLPRTPEVDEIPGGHFIFTDICPPALSGSAPELCQDPPGVDRAAVHAEVQATIIAFLAKHLQAAIGR